jgi:hypothetical protein
LTIHAHNATNRVPSPSGRRPEPAPAKAGDEGIIKILNKYDRSHPLPLGEGVLRGYFRGESKIPLIPTLSRKEREFRADVHFVREALNKCRSRSNPLSLALSPFQGGEGT